MLQPAPTVVAGVGPESAELRGAHNPGTPVPFARSGNS